MQVWVVTRAAWDGDNGTDTSVDSVFSTEAAAREYVAKKNAERASAYASEYDYEEFQIQ